MATCVFRCSNRSNILQVAMESRESEGHRYFTEFFGQISENSTKLQTINRILTILFGRLQLCKYSKMIAMNNDFKRLFDSCVRFYSSIHFSFAEVHREYSRLLAPESTASLYRNIQTVRLYIYRPMFESTFEFATCFSPSLVTPERTLHASKCSLSLQLCFSFLPGGASRCLYHSSPLRTSLPCLMKVSVFFSSFPFFLFKSFVSFPYQRLPFRDTRSLSWRWFDEAFRPRPFCWLVGRTTERNQDGIWNS